MALAVLLVLVGLAGLARGADSFVLGASRLATAFRISPVVVGAVIVGFGTGLPELIVSGSAASRGSLDIAVGNVVGSNLANLTLVLGVAGLMARPAVLPRVLRREAPLAFGTVVLVAVLIQGGLSRLEGLVLLAALAAAVAVMLRAAQHVPRADPPVDEPAAVTAFVHEVEEMVVRKAAPPVPDRRGVPFRRDIVRTATGLLATVLGAQILVLGAQRVAAGFGLSGGFVGLTLVAVGTSLPELVTAIQSARRDETALLIGNVLGSNVFNSTAVAGTAALVGPGALVDTGLTLVAAGSMVVVAAVGWLFLVSDARLRRREAVVLLALYAATIPLSA